MKKLIIFIVMVLCSCGGALAQDWTTPEALRAFGKPGDTVRGSAPDTISNNGKSGEVHQYTPEEWKNVRQSQAYKDYIRELQRKQTPSRPNYSRSTTSGDESSKPSYLTGSKEEVWQQCKNGFLNKLENPGSSIFEDKPMEYKTIEPNGNFHVTTTMYSKTGDGLKQFIGICEGNTTDYGSIKIRVWKSKSQ